MEQQMIFSVSEANNFIKALLDRVPQLQEIFVRGEISNYKLYPSGHHYFTLKDAEGAMRCVLFKGNALRLRFRPENGMKVIAFGRISVFPRDGAYQLYVSELSPEGAGDLHVAFEQLKAQLEREGLFDPAHKKPLPRYPKTIAIITSPHSPRALAADGGQAPRCARAGDRGPAGDRRRAALRKQV